MRTLTFLSLAFVLALAAQASAQEISDKESIGLKGPVKTVRSKLSVATQGRTDAGARLFDSEITFDREGRKTEETHYKPDGSIERRIVFTYDAAGRTEVTYNPDGTVQHKLFKQKEEFDEKSRIGRLIITGYDGALYSEFVRKYDERGRWLETSVYDRAGKLQTRSVNIFGTDGTLQEFVHYNGAGVVLHRYVRVSAGMQFFVYDNGALVSTETPVAQVCAESDPYGNCKSMTTTKSVSKGGKVEEVINTNTRSFTYY